MIGTKFDGDSWGPLLAAGQAFVGSHRRLWRRAAFHVLLLFMLVGALVIAPRVSEATVAIGIDPPTGQLILSLLLAAVAIRLHRRLRPQVDAEVLQQAHALQDALRRYVPGVVAAHLESGRELDFGERDVSVLFVDIRGYTTLSEGCTAADIFSTVNRYTDAVSTIVRHHGGCVVEFHGDGLMAVFGAPSPLPLKERAAVEAGRAIVAVMRSGAAGTTASDSVALSVGVGIATGTAYVGNLQTVDRVIWTVIGNIPNLAARLEMLTRDLDAAIIIDGPTWQAAREAATGFELHAHVPIRGRRDAADVYAIPLRPASPVVEPADA